MEGRRLVGTLEAEKKLNRAKEIGIEEDGLEPMEAEVNKIVSLLADARRLSRNVPFSFEYCATSLEAEERSINLREEVQHTYEFVGLNGWNLIMLIGQRKQALQDKGEPHTAHDVAVSLQKIKWGRGREVTKSVAEKMLTIYSRLKSNPTACMLMQTALGLFGRQGPFEDYQKLILLIQKTKTDQDLCFCWLGDVIFLKLV